MKTKRRTPLTRVRGTSLVEPLEARIAPANFLVTNTNDAGAGSLRNAINQANTTPGADQIVFNIGAAPFVIAPLTPLPTITEAVDINGYSQPGTSLNNAATGTNAVLRIELSGVAQSGGHGLVLGGSGGSVVRGLVVRDFGPGINDNGSGIVIQSDNNTVVGNFLGTDVTGQLDAGNGASGVRVGLFTGTDNFTGNTIGGPGLGQRNLISGNAMGILLTDDSFGTQVLNNLIGTTRTGGDPIPNVTIGIGNSGDGTVIGAPSAGNVISGNGGWGINTSGTNTTIQGNIIGLNAAGTSPLPNARSGVNFSNGANGGLVGGVNVGAGNIISGNSDEGIEIGSSFGDGPANNIVVQGNRIGTDAGGAAFGNGGPGIGVYGTSNATIGGVNPGEANVIAFNFGPGVRLSEVSGPIAGARISGNGIFSNNGLGIDLDGGLEDAFGVTQNDPLDADSGPNGLANAPTLTNFNNTGANVSVMGTLDAQPMHTYEIQIFASGPEQVSFSGTGDGTVYLGSTTVTTDASGLGPINFSAAIGGLPGNTHFTALAIDQSGGATSEFSNAIGQSTAYTWTGAVSTDWFDPMNWAPNGVPGALDTANYNGGTNPIDLLAGVSVAIFNHSAGAMIGGGQLFILQNWNWTGGTHDGPGIVLNLPATASFNGATPLVWQNGQLDLFGTGFVDGAGVNFNAGAFSVLPSGALILNSAGLTDADGAVTITTFSNTGYVSKQGAGTYGVLTTTVENYSLLEAGQGQFELSDFLQLDGELRLTGGSVGSTAPLMLDGGFLTGTGSIDAAVQHNGATVQPGGPGQAGTITVLGNFLQSPDAVLEIEIGGLSPGTQYDQLVVQDTAALDNDLLVSFLGGFSVMPGQTFTFITADTRTGTFNTVTGAGPLTPSYTATSAQLISASTTYVWDAGGGADLSWSNPLNWSPDGVPGAADSAILNTAAIIDLTAPVTVANFQQTQGTVTGGGALTITNGFDWRGGTMSGPSTLTIATGATATLNGPVVKTLDRRFLDNQGTVNVVGTGNLVFQNGPLFTNAGTFDFQSDADLRGLDGIGATWVNTGTLRKSAGTDVTIIGENTAFLTFNNTGVLDANAGTLELRGAGGTFGSGTALTPDTGATLAFAAGTYTFPNSFIVNDPGTLLFSGATINVNGLLDPSPVTQFVLAAGVLGGTGDVNINGTMTFTGGTMTGTGDTFVDTAGTLIFAGAGTKLLDGRYLVNNGVVNVTGTGDVQLTNSAQIDSTGLWDFQGDADLAAIGANAGVFTNFPGAVVRKSAGSGESIISAGSPTLPFGNFGTLEAQSGRLTLAGGGAGIAPKFRALTGAEIVFAAGTQNLSGATSFEGGGIFRTTGGTVNIADGSTLNDTGTVLRIEGGTFTLAGTFTANANTAVVLAGGALGGTGTLSLNASELSGAGTIAGSVANPSGFVRPGGNAAAGTLTIGGTYTQGAGASLDAELGGTGAGQFDVLSVGGTATLAGTLVATTLGGFVPVGGSNFNVVTATNRSGTFDTTTTPGFLSRYVGADTVLTAGSLLVTNTNDSGPGSLRDALLTTNALPGLDAITFNLPSAGVQTIAPATPLPTITEAVTIDGYSQPGTSVNTLPTGSNAVLLVELNGTSVSGPGLTITAGGSTIRGLIINRFGGDGISLSGAAAGGNVIEGNFIGTNATGTAALGNNGKGVDIRGGGDGNLIGGTTAAARNVISGNNATGIEIANAGTTANIVRGNIIGLTASGLAALGNGAVGIFIIGATGNTIGGTSAAERNVISANAFHGIGLNTTTGNVVQGNFIGTDATGAGVFGNAIFGVLFNDGDGNTIGGTAPGAGNLIANNNLAGVFLDPLSSSNAIRGNAIRDNVGLGIDVQASGEPIGTVTPNDPGDGDGGANQLQNYPVLTSATRTGTASMINGTLNSTPGTAFALDFFASATADPSGFGEGAIYLGSTGVTTDTGGNIAFNFTSPIALAPGQVITATATNPATGDTSEFSAVRSVTSTFVWDGGGGADTSWFNPLNWDFDAGVPGTSDTAILQTAQTINLPSNTSVGTFQQSNGTFTSAAGVTFTVLNAFDWTGGTQSGTGSTAVPAGGSATLGGAAVKTLNARTLSLAGSTAFTSTTDLQVAGGATIANTGVFDLQGNAGLAGSGTFSNAAGATVQRSGTADTNTIAISLAGGGTWVAQTGTLRFTGGGGAGNGVFSASPGATLALDGGTFAFSGTSMTVNGGGALELRSGTASIAPGVILAVTGAGTTLRINGGTLNINGVANIAAGSTFDLSSGTLGDSGNLNVSGAATWSGGTMTGTGQVNILTGAVLTLSGAADKTLDGKAINPQGTVNIGGTGNLVANNGAALNLSATGIVAFQSDASIVNTAGTVLSISNGGTLRKTGGTGTSSISATLANSSLVSALSGRIALLGSGTSNGGTFNADTGATVAFTSGTPQLTGNTTFSGAGTISVEGAAVTGSGTITVNAATRLTLATGAFGGTANLNVNGAMTWLGGTWFGGTRTIASGATLTIDSTTAHPLSNGVLNNSGTINFINGAGLTFFNTAALNNSGLIDFQTDSVLTRSSGTAALANLTGGILRKSGGAGATQFGGALAVTNAGTVEALSGTLDFAGGFTQSSGLTELRGGNLAGTLTLNGGTLAGTGNVGTVANNGATISPGRAVSGQEIGTILVAGNYTQGTGGTLAVELGGTGAGQFDVLNVTGNATLDGTLNLAHLGGFVPAGGNTFRVVQSANDPTTFTTLTGATAGKTQAADATGLVITQGGVTFIWDGGAGTQDWFNPINWDLDSGVPGASDTAILQTAQTIRLFANATVGTFQQTNGAFGGVGGVALTVQNSFVWSAGPLFGGGTLTLAAGSTATLSGSANKVFDNFTLNNNGTVLLTGTGNITTNNGGTINNAGLLEIQSDASLLQTGSSLTLNNSGTVRKTGGSGTTEIQVGFVNGSSALVEAQSGVVLFSGALDAGGTFTAAGGAVQLAGTTTLAATATFNGVELVGGLRGTGTVTGNWTWSAGTAFGGGAMTIAAGSTLTLSGSAAKRLDNFGVNNNGTVRVTGTGNLEVNNGFQPINNAGLFEIQTDADFVDVGAGTPELNNSGTVRKTGGAGTTDLSGNFANSTGALVEAQSGVVLFSGALDAGGTFTAAAGAVQLAGTTTLASAVAFNGVEQAGGLRGTGTVTGSWTWSAGAFFGGGAVTLPAGSTLTLTGTAAKELNNFTVNNNGTVAWTGAGNLNGGNGFAINNTGVFDIQTDADVVNLGGGTPVLNNTGTVRKTGGIAATDFNGTFNNNTGALVHGQSGILRFAGELSAGGTFTAAAGAVQFAGATTLASTATWNGIEMTGGSGQGTGTVTGNWTWSDGTFFGGGAVTIPAGSTLTLAGSAAKGLDNFDVNNNGTVVWSGTGNVTGGNSPVINNAGVFDLQSDASMTAIALSNSGTVQKSGGGGTSTFNGTFTNTGSVLAQSGTMSFTGAGFTQTAGTTQLAGGGLSTSGMLRFNGGELLGAGTLTGAVNNAGATIRPGGTGAAGTITISGTYTQGAGGTLAAELGGTGAGQFDVLNVSGNATLDGTLNIAHISAFTPAVGNSFRVVQSANNPTTFTTLAGQTTGITQTADATGLVITRGGVTFIWDGGGGADQSWFNPINWNLDSGVPGADDTAILQTAQTINLPSDTSVGAFQQSNGTFTSAAGVTFTVLTNFAWTAGTQTGSGTTTLDTGGTLTISGAGLKQLTTRSLINNGTMNLGGGIGVTVSNATITNNGVLNATDEADLAGSGSGGFINSATGTLNKTGAGTTSQFYIFTNAGTINATSGTLNFSNGFTQTAGATVLGGGSITGSFAFNFNAGELRGTGSIGTNATLVNNGATIRPGGTGAAGTLTIAAAYNHNAGARLALEVAGAGAGQFDVLAVTGTSSLIGPAEVALLGGFTPGAGNTFPVLTAASRSGGFQFVNGPLVPQYNPTNVTLVVPTAGQYTWDAGAGTGDTSWFNPLNWSPDGVPGATDSATLAIAATTTLPSNHSVGTLFHDGRTVGNNSIFTIPSGVTLTVLNDFTWRGGVENGAGTLTVAPGATFNYPGTSAQNAVLDARTLNLQGTSTFSHTSSETISLTLATINNSGALEIRHALNLNQTVGSSGALNNLAGGTIRGTTSSTSLIMGNSVPFTNAGTVRTEAGTLTFSGGYTQTAGSTQIAGGNLQSAGFLQLQGGEFTGVGTISAAIFNAGGVVRPGGTGATGTLTTGGYNAQVGGTIELEIAGAGAGQFDVLTTTGSVVLNGTLNAPLLGGFTPGTGSSFRVLDPAGSVIGTFATVNSTLTPQYNASDVTLLGPTGPLTYIWDGGAGTTVWDNPLNWNLDSGFPGAADIAILQTAQTIDLAATARTVASFQQSDGTLAGTANLTVTGNLLWSGGTMTGTGTTSAAGAASLIDGSVVKFLSRRLENSGTLTIASPDATGDMRLGTAGLPGVLANLAGGTVNVTAGGDFSQVLAVAGQGISNAGSWNTSGAGTVSSIAGVAFNNTNAVNVNSGRLELSDGTSTGAFTLAASGTLGFVGGTYTLNAGTNLTGAGTVVAGNSGAVTFNAGTWNVGATTISGGTATLNAAATTGSLGINGGGILDGSGLLNVTGNLAWSNGTMTGTGTTRVAGAASLIDSGDIKFLIRRLENVGTLTIASPDSGGEMRFGSGALPGVLANLAGGTVNVTAGADFNPSVFVAGQGITNAGTWNTSGAGSVSNVSGVAFNNTNAVNVNSGALVLSDGTNTGAFTLAASGTLGFIGGTYTLNAGTNLIGAGTVDVGIGGAVTFNAGTWNVGATTVSGVATLNAAATTGSLGINSGGILDGSGLLNVTGNLAWSNGTMTGTGTTRVAGAASLIDSGDIKFLSRRLENSGTMTIASPDSGGEMRFGSGVLPGVLANLAGGTVNVTAGADFNPSVFVAGQGITNAGIWNTSGAGTASRVTGIAFNNTNAVNVNSGALELEDGTSTGTYTVAGAAGLAFTFGTHALSGTVTGSFTNSGATIAVGGIGAAGTLTVTGNYTQTASGTLAVELGGTGAGQFDRLIAGTATLGGTLNIANLGGFTPAGGNQFRVVQSGNNPGTFASLTGATAGISQTADAAGLLLSVASTGETDVAISGGNLVVTDINGGTSNDTLTITLVGANVRVSDPGNVLVAGAGATQIDLATVEVPLASITGNIQVNTLGGDDTLTLALAGGDFIVAGGLDYAAGTQGGAGDALVITGGAQGTVNYAPANATDGTLGMTAFGTVTVTGLENTTNSGTATNVVFNLPASANAITLGDDGTTGNGLTRFSGATVWRVDFPNPSDALSIIRGNAADTLTVNALPDFNASLNLASSVNPLAALTFAGGVTLGANKSLTSATSGTTTFNAAFVTSGTGNIQLTAGDLVLGGGAGSLAGAGVLQLLPATAASTIGIGAGATGAFNLDATDLTALADGFSSITIGLATGTGAVDIKASTFLDNVSVVGGAIDVTGLNAGANDVTLTTTNGPIRNGGDALTDITGGNVVVSKGGPANGTDFIGIGSAVGPGAPGLKVDAATLSATSSIGSTAIESVGTGGIAMSILHNNAFGTGNIFLASATEDVTITSAAISGSGFMSIQVAGHNLSATNLTSNTGVFAGDFTLETLGSGNVIIGSASPANGTVNVNSAGNIVVNGPIAGSTNTTWSTGGSITGAGNVTLAGSANFNAAANGAIDLTGALTVPGATTLAAGAASNITLPNAGSSFAAMNITGGTLLVNGTLTATSVAIASGAALAGTGTVVSNVSNSGTVRPGGTGTAGVLTINGNYTQLAAGTLALELGGTSPGQFDALNVVGTATLAGTLNTTLLGGFTPMPLDTFGVLTSNALTGTFAPENLPPGFTSSYGTAALTLSAGAPPNPLEVNTALDLINPADTFTSLREAILFANANAGLDTITFNIPGTGVQTIALGSALPDITDPAIIDGYSQPGAVVNTSPDGFNGTLLIVLDGSTAGAGADGLGITGGGSTVRGLIINHFAGDGIQLAGAGSNLIVGNIIGSDAAGTLDQGNGGTGVSVVGGNGNMIGGSAFADRNVIAFNSTGVAVATPSRENAILGNVIFGNAALGIDLGGDGATPNDGDDSDTGANDLHNFPVITQVFTNPAGATAIGTLTVATAGAVRLEFFIASAGEGRVFLGSTVVTGGAGTAVSFVANITGAVNVGDFLVATASDLAVGGAGTSEFSAPVVAQPPAVISIADAIVVEGDAGPRQLTFRLTLDRAVPLPVTVNFATQDFTADAGLDYTALTGTVTFAANETEQTFTVTVNGDTRGEFRERFRVNFTTPVNAALPDAEAFGIIADDDRDLIAAGDGGGGSFTIHRLTPDGEQRIAQIVPFTEGYRGGVRVAVGDVNGDGLDDFIAGAGLGGRGRVRVFDGATFEPVAGVLGDFSPFGSTYRGGVFVAAGDVNGDGCADVIVAPSAGSQNRVRVFDGATGGLLSDFRAFGKGSAGVRIAAGDVNGDGLDDVIAGTGAGSGVRIFDALAGVLLPGVDSAFRAFPKAYKGGVFVSAEDLDFDGRDEVIVGAAAGSADVRAFAASGAMQEFTAFRGALRGVRLTALDVTGDGIAEIIAAQGRKGSGKVQVLDGTDFKPLYDFAPFGKEKDGIYLG